MPEKSPNLRELLAILDSIAPFSLAEAWDNVGLMVGDLNRPVTGVLVALDPTGPLIDEALARQCNVILTHHPLLFLPLKKLETNSPVGQTLSRVLAADLAVLACHTNLDRISEGVSTVMAKRLGLLETKPLAANPVSPQIGFGAVGSFPTPLSAEQFLARLFDTIDCEGIQLIGALPARIHTVALCGGSGSDLAEAALSAGAQIYLTAEVKHSVARWAEAAGLCLIDAGHYPTENLIVPVLTETLGKACQEAGFALPVVCSDRQNNPMRWLSRHQNKPTTPVNY